MEIRALVIMIILTTTALGAILGLTFGTLSTNGVVVPPSANQSALLTYENNQFKQTYNTSLNKTGLNLQVPQNNLGFIGAFFVFGGLIVSVFGYIAAVPQALGSILTVYTGTLSTAAVAISVINVIYVIAGLVTAVAGVMILFEIISSVQKYRT